MLPLIATVSKNPIDKYIFNGIVYPELQNVKKRK